MTTFRTVAKNVAIIGVGAGLIVWWENKNFFVSRKVRTLVHEAVELEKEGRLVDNGTRARKKWREALALSNSSDLSPSVQFNLSFALACSLDEAGEDSQAEMEFSRSLKAFPPGFDVHSLPENTRNRVGVALDRLAQKQHDRGQYNQAMSLYDRACDALASPSEVANMDSSFLQRRTNVETVAAVLHNISVLYNEIGKPSAAEQAAVRSRALLDALQMSQLNLDSKENF